MSGYNAGFINVQGNAYFDPSGSNTAAIKTSNLVVNGSLTTNTITVPTITTTTVTVNGNLQVPGTINSTLLDPYGSYFAKDLSSNIYAPDLLLSNTSYYISMYQQLMEFPQNTTQEILDNLINIPSSVFNTIGVTDLSNTAISDVSGTYIRNSNDDIVINDNGNAVVWNGITPYPFLTDTVFTFNYEFCPSCARERWPIIIALSRFGTFKGLENIGSSLQNQSSIQSFTFRDLDYTSEYFTLQTIENLDRFINPLQNPTSYQAAVLHTFDLNGTAPFISFGNKLVLGGDNNEVLNDMGDFDGLSRSRISNYLTDTTNPITQGIIAEANYITACISVVTGNEPSSVCNSAGVLAAKAALGIN